MVSILYAMRATSNSLCTLDRSMGLSYTSYVFAAASTHHIEYNSIGREQ